MSIVQCLGAGAVVFAAALASAQASFTILSSPPGSIGEVPVGVSNNGAFAAGSYRIDGAGNSTACTWDSANGLRPLLGGFARAVSDDGAVIAVQDPFERLMVVDEGGFRLIQSPFGGTAFGNHGAITPDGRRITGYFLNAARDNEPFLWTEATGLVPLGLTPGSHQGYATGISPSGLLISGWMDEGGSDIAFRWTEGAGYETLEEFEQGPRLSQGFDLSDDGAVVVGKMGSDPGYWSRDGRATPIPFFGTMRDGIALACSGDGRVIVGEMNDVTDRRAFIWDEVHGSRELREAFRDDYGLDMTGITLERAYDISQDGRVIVGVGHLDGSNADVAWRAVIPAPGTGMAGVIGFVVGVSRRRR